MFDSRAEAPSARTTVQRLRARADYRPETVEAILDEGFVAHVGLVADGQPYVLPMAYARLGRRLYLHGSRASRLLRTLAGGAPVCVTVTILDGLVLARSAFHHSMNYRSVVVLGRAEAVTDAGERAQALSALVDHAVPGRSRTVRGPSGAELRATLVVRIPLEEASAKIRVGPPVDDEADLALPVWAGELPLRLTAGAPVADRSPGVTTAPAIPLAVRDWAPTGARGS